MVRLTVRVPIAYVRTLRRRFGTAGQKALLRDVQTRVAALGYSPAYAALQDPTDETRFTVLAESLRATPGASTARGFLQILGAENVERPAVLDPSERAPALDSGLAPDEAAAIDVALRHDVDPRHVGAGGLPAVLEPYYPASATLLRAKGALLEKQIALTPADANRLIQAALAPAADDTLRKAQAEFLAFAAKSPLPIALLRDHVREAALAHALGAPAPFPDAINALARQLVVQVPFTVGGTSFAIPLVAPRKLAAALPPSPDDGFVSPSALQLALALQKPRWSGVGSPDAIGRVNAQIRPGATDTRTLRARHQMARATKAIDRRRWVEWYRHHRRLRIESL